MTAIINELEMTSIQLLGTDSPLMRGNIVVRNDTEYAVLQRFIFTEESPTRNPRRVRLLNIRHGRVESFDLTDNAGLWVVKKDDAGLIQSCDANIVNLAQSFLAQVSENDRLVNVESAQREDWDKLNGFLLDEAERRDWCGELEKVLDTWNEAFKTFELRGRSKPYLVEVEVTATYTIHVRVDDCKDEDAAIDYVNNMDSWEIMSDSNDGEWSSPDDVEAHVASATVDE